MELGILIAAQAREWVNERVKYRHRGMTRRGCDCTGLPIGIMQELGYLKNYKLRYYPIDWNLHKGEGEFILDELKKFADEVEKDKIEIGDVLIFKFGRCESHSGIYIGRRMFVHCYREKGYCHYGKLAGSNWADRWTKVFRFNKDKL